MQSLSLYSAADALAPLLDQIDEDGVISGELAAALAQFEGKGKAVAAYILNQEATISAIDNTIKVWEGRADALRKRSDALKRYLLDNMKRTGVTQIIADDGTFAAKLYLERDKSVEIFDEKQIPVAYLSMPEPPAPKPDKKRIKASLDAGTDVPGARILRKDRLEIK
jgi:hypothetical protein